jgi:galactokinase
MPDATGPEGHVFMDMFQRPAEVTAAAPGRVNLIGEHTDYNDGFVLPAAIPQRTRVWLARRGDERVRARSAEAPRGEAAYTLGEERRAGRWTDYVQGATHVLAAAGRRIAGFDLWIRSDVPLGSGLSSSASLLVALLRGLRRLFTLEIGDEELARMAHRAETDFVGAPVGVMDPFAVSFADEAHALLLDCRTMAFERVALPGEAGLCVIYSGVHHRLAATGGYRERRGECERAAAALGVPALRDLGPADAARVARLPAPLDRRVRHVVSENQRVTRAAAAMREGDLDALGVTMLASHRSMRDDYEVSVPEIDALVELAAADPEVFGARLTGGGFGGSVVIVARASGAAATARRIAAAYARASGRTPRVLVPA